MPRGPTPVSGAKAKLAFGWPCHNRIPRVGFSTTPKDPRNLPVVDESRVRTAMRSRLLFAPTDDSF
jgi:hypothetical protein